MERRDNVVSSSQVKSPGGKKRNAAKAGVPFDGIYPFLGLNIGYEG
jgi:hypothetical protein